MIKTFSYAIVPLIVLGLGANWIINIAHNSHEIPTIKTVPEFSFIDQNGVSFTEKKLKNKVTVLDFMFTSCTGPCPLMTINMSKLHKTFSEQSEVQFVSVTVDPLIDNQKKLKEYSMQIGGDDGRWYFLWSDIDSIKDLKRNGFMLFADNLPQGHAIKFVLIDDQGNIRKYYDGTDKSSQAILSKDIAQLVKSLRS